MIKIMVPYKIESLNVIIRKHWSYRSREKKTWMDLIHMLGGKKIYKDIPYTKVTILSKRKRLLDKDNCYGGAKLVIDAIKELGLIEDDSLDKIELKVEQVKSKDEETLITLDK